MIPFIKRMIFASFPFLVATLCLANGDLCHSEEFRYAFIDGWESIDWPSWSDLLISFGDEALPCLLIIVEGGGKDLGIEACVKDPDGCSVRAMGFIGRIGTPKARECLIHYLDPETRKQVLISAIGMLGSLKAIGARPSLLKLLNHSDMHIRSKTILTLGVIGKHEDFDALLKATLSLPQEEIYWGAHGLLKLGDARAIEPLEQRASHITDPIYKKSLQHVIEKMRVQCASTPSDK